MVLQAPWVFNLALDYAHSELGLGARVLYNVAGPRIIDVGTEGVDDEYIQPRHAVDFSMSKQWGDSFKTKLTVTDILNTDHVVTVGKDADGPVTSRYSDGTGVSVGASYSF